MVLSRIQEPPVGARTQAPTPDAKAVRPGAWHARHRILPSRPVAAQLTLSHTTTMQMLERLLPVSTIAVLDLPVLVLVGRAKVGTANASKGTQKLQQAHPAPRVPLLRSEPSTRSWRSLGGTRTTQSPLYRHCYDTSTSDPPTVMFWTTMQSFFINEAIGFLQCFGKIGFTYSLKIFMA